MSRLTFCTNYHGNWNRIEEAATIQQLFHVGRRELEHEESSGNCLDGHRKLTGVHYWRQSWYHGSLIVDTKLVSQIRRQKLPLHTKSSMWRRRRELERKFEIVLFAESARMELKSSVNESYHLPKPVASIFVVIRAEHGE